MSDVQHTLPSALITGISGQAGSYLAELLLEKGYEVHGLVRRTSLPLDARIAHLAGRVHLHEGDLTDSGSLVRVVKTTKPDEIYHLAAQSFVPTSFQAPLHTAEVTGLGTLRLLEAVRQAQPHAKVYQASTSEMFGASPPPQHESTPFRPRSPYGAAKLFAHHIAVHHREAYGMFVACGICFNFESPRRGSMFVTKKIAVGAARIAKELRTSGGGKVATLTLGNLDAARDWTHAKDSVRAMHALLQHPTPMDCVIASGTLHTVRDFARLAFARVDLDYEAYVEVAPHLFRPTDVHALQGDARRARAELGWSPTVSFEQLVHEMVDAEVAALRSR